MDTPRIGQRESSPLSAIVLAAGQGTRMCSERPKPVHLVGGRPLVGHVIEALGAVDPQHIVVVVGHGAQAVIEAVGDEAHGVPVIFAEQTVQRGTGDAVKVALDAVTADVRGEAVVVLPGDAPLLRGESIGRAVELHRTSGAAATVITARLGDPYGYGRILRDDSGDVTGVVEQVDATPEQALIDEVNTSMYCFDRAALVQALAQIVPDNAQGEWYLTDVIGVLHADGRRVVAYELADADEARGVNDRTQLAAAEATLRQRINDRWMRAGVTMIDPFATWIGDHVELARDVTLHPGVVLGGTTVIGERAEIGPHAVIVDATVGDGAYVGASAVIQAGAVVEPMGRVDALAHLVGAPGRAQA